MTTAEHDHHDDQIGHIVPVKFLALICGILLFLTAVTVWVSRYDFADINISELNIIVAMAVATIKATLVGLYFMHLRWDRPVIGFIYVFAILLVVLFWGRQLGHLQLVGAGVDEYGVVLEHLVTM